MDLFTPIVSIENQHSNFRAITIPGRCEGELEVIQSWAEGFTDRDGKFVKEFQTTFNSSFWELYLNAAFRQLGFVPDYSKPSPDFILSGQTDIVAEATIASHPAGFIPEWERAMTAEALASVDPAAIVELATIRLANAISSKSRKFVEQYAKLDHVVGRPFVLCVAPFEQPGFFFQSDQAIRRVLYGYDQPLWIEERSTGDRIVVGESLVDRVRKESGANVELGVFLKPGLEHISAIIFSPVATFGKVRALARPGPYPVGFQAFRYAADAQHHRVIVGYRPNYKESLLDGLHVLLNPRAKYPLDLRPFQHTDIAIHTFGADGYHCESHDGFLFLDKLCQLSRLKTPRALQMSAVSGLMHSNNSYPHRSRKEKWSR